MKRLLLVALLAAGCSSVEKKDDCTGCKPNAPAPTGLTVEYRENPVGLDAVKPRLGWKMNQGARARDVREVAYEILAASTRAKLDAGEGDLWSTGRIEADGNVNIPWGGKPLVTSQRVWWKVRTWCNWGYASKWSEPAEFTMGVTDPADWKAKWIGPAPCTRPDEDFGAGEWITAPADAKGVATLTRTFDWDGRGTVEIVHAGVSEHGITVNGRDFHKWSGHVNDWRYLRFRDLTPWLKKGANVLTVTIQADKPRTAADPIDPIRVHAPKDVRAFLAKIVFADGRCLVTDGAWTSPGGAVKTLGRVRDTSWGRALVLRAENASPAFAKTFDVTKPVASAVLHVTGVGFYEASLNGAKIGRKVLDPAPTAYDKRVLYSTYRLDEALKPGANELRILVGHGWYDQRAVATWNFETSPWRDFPRTIAQLEIAYADGSRQTVVTDATWRQVKSPIGYDDNFEGEVTGAWNPAMPDLEGTVVNAVEVPAPRGRLTSEAQPGAEIMRTIPAKAVKDCGGGTYVIDFGENLAGWMRFTLRGQKKGDTVSFRYDERVNGDGSPAAPSNRDGLNDFRFSNELKPANPSCERRAIDAHFLYTASQRVCAKDAAFQTDRFVCSGAAEERYEPRFQYSGFRYVVARGLARPPAPTDATACVIHTAFPTIGSFECSDPVFNKLMEMGDKAYRGNFADGVPTDCPHREKNGWTGDASIASELAQYLYENTAGYEKWLGDLRDAQLADGNLPGIVPSSGWGYHWGNGPGWDSALPVVAWNLYLYRDDRRILDMVYPVLKRYLAYTATKANGGLVKHGLGDWVPVHRDHMPAFEFTSSCYYLQAQRICALMAEAKGECAEAAKYAAGAETTRKALRAKYAKGGGTYDNGLQTAQACALAFGIPEPAEIPAVEARLIAACEATDGHVDMGLFGTKHVFRALSRAGRTDLAYKMLVNPTSPSPADWVRKGGTTLWEDWSDGSSRNHIMFGDFLAWAYQYLAGIRLPETKGSCAAIPTVSARAFRHVTIAPQVIPALSYVKARVDGPYGPVESAWRRTAAGVEVTVRVPANTRATVKLPDGTTRETGSGTYVFTCAK